MNSNRCGCLTPKRFPRSLTSRDRSWKIRVSKNSPIFDMFCALIPGSTHQHKTQSIQNWRFSFLWYGTCVNCRSASLGGHEDQSGETSPTLASSKFFRKTAFFQGCSSEGGERGSEPEIVVLTKSLCNICKGRKPINALSEHFYTFSLFALLRLPGSLVCSIRMTFPSG